MQFILTKNGSAFQAFLPEQNKLLAKALHLHEGFLPGQLCGSHFINPINQENKSNKNSYQFKSGDLRTRKRHTGRTTKYISITCSLNIFTF